MPVLNYWKMRNSRKSVSVLLIVLMLLSMLPVGAWASGSTTSAAISPATAEYDLAAPGDVSTIITWNDAASVVSVVYDGVTLGETVYGVVYIDAATSTLTIQSAFFTGLDPAVTEGAVLPFTISFDVGDTATFTVTVVDIPVTGVITGTVTDFNENPVKNAHVEITWSEHDVPTTYVLTDVYGNYVLEGLLPGTYVMMVTPPSGAFLARTRIPNIAVTAGQTTLQDVTLQEGGIVTGTVRDLTGSPVKGASVTFFDPATGGSGFARTDETGNYSVGLLPGTHEMRVMPWGTSLASARIPGIVAAAEKTTIQDVTLLEGGTIEVRVVDFEGTPVANAWVTLWDSERTHAISRVTDTQGSITTAGIVGLVPGFYDVQVTPHPGDDLLRRDIYGIEVTAGEITAVSVTLTNLAAATAAVEAAEAAPLTTQEEIDAAQTLHDAAMELVNALPEGEAKDGLLDSLFAVQNAIRMAKRPVIEITSPASGEIFNRPQIVTVSGRVYSRLSNVISDVLAWRGQPFDEVLTATVYEDGSFAFDLWWKEGSSSIEGPFVEEGNLESSVSESIYEDGRHGIRFTGAVDHPGAVVTFRYHGYEMIGEAGLLSLDGEGDFTWSSSFESGERHYIIWAWDQHDNFAQAIRTVTVLPAPVSVTITPSATTANTGQSVTFSATVGPSGAQQSVDWSVYSGPGTITAGGIFSSPTAGTSVIRATSTVDSAVYGQATVVVVAPDPAPAPAPTPTPTPTPTPPAVVEQPIVAGQVTEVKLKGVIAVTVTAGAVTGEAPKITAQVMPEAAAAPLMAAATGVGLTAASEVVVLSMTGGEFTAPVQLTLNFDAAKVAAGQVPAVFVYNERTGRWIFLGGQVGDGTITVTVDRFSRFAVFATKALPALADIADHWGRGSIRTLAGMGIVSGLPDGRFNPNAGVTRAEFVSMLTRALGLEAKPQAAARFTDAAGWAQGAIGAAAEAGLVAGYADGTFGGSRRITRAEMAVILQRVIRRGLVPVIWTAGADFADAQALPAWAADAIGTANRAGLVRGFQDRTFRPGSTTTRAEAAAMLYRLVAER